MEELFIAHLDSRRLKTAKSDKSDDAVKLLDEISVQTVITWNCII